MRNALPVAAAVSLLLGPSASSQTRPGTAATSGGSRIISPSVVATAIFESSSGGDAELQLLVLWRGAPGWFLGADQRGSWTRGDSGPASRDSAVPENVIVHLLSFGTRSFEVRLHSNREAAEVAGQVVSLREGRAVIVDGVDRERGSIVVGTRQIGTRASGIPPRIEPLLREAPELAAFLRCEQSLENVSIQTMVAETCRQILGR